MRGAFVTLLAVLLLLGALELRLPGMTRPLWEDEVHHNEPVLATATPAALDQNGMYLAMFQPKLDFAMRKRLWFPLLGVNERAFRLPALGWGLLLVLLVYATLLTYFRARLSLGAATLLAFVGALWIVDNPMAIRLSCEGRHYAFVMFASSAWCAVLLLFEGRPRWLLGALTLLFANTHFFALPVIGAGYALQIGRELRRREWRFVPLHLAVLAGVCLCTVRYNLPPLEALLHRPPSGTAPMSAPLLAALSRVHLLDAFALWRSYARALHVGPATSVLWLALLAAAFAWREWRFVPLLLAVFVGLPLLFAYMRLRSSYPFDDRYFSAFFGFGLVTLATTLDLLQRLWTAVEPRLPERGRALARASALVVLAFALGGPTLSYRIVAMRGDLRVPPANFSPYYRAYGEIALGGPALVVHTHCWADDIPRLYATYFLPRGGHRFEWVDLRGCQTPLPAARARIAQFLARPGAIIVLDDKEHDCAARVTPTFSPLLSVERLSSVTACVWKVRGATSLAQLAQVAAALGFSEARSLSP